MHCGSMGAFTRPDLDGEAHEASPWRLVIHFFFNGTKLDIKRVSTFIHLKIQDKSNTYITYKTCLM